MEDLTTNTKFDIHMGEFFKSAFRHIFHNKVFAIVNIAGLSIGIGCGLVIYKIISYESGFDSYHQNYSNIYRLINKYDDPVHGLRYDEGQVHPIGEALRNDFSGVDAAMCFYAAKGQITIENKDGSWQSWRAATRNPVDALRYE